MSQKIRIKLKSYDYNLVDKSAEKIVKTVKAVFENEFIDGLRVTLVGSHFGGSGGYLREAHPQLDASNNARGCRQSKLVIQHKRAIRKVIASRFSIMNA